MWLHALLALAATATVMPQTLEQLADRSTHVVRAVVVSHSSAREPGPAGIYTRTTLRIEESLKGSAPKTLVVRQAGGKIGTESVELIGDASLAEGERVLAFVSCAPGRDFCALVGLAQGKFHLADDGHGGFTATRDFSKTSFAATPAPTRGPDSYAALARQIRKHVEGVK
jgi:hypothetical protein